MLAFDPSVSIGDMLTAAALGLALFAGWSGLNQWRADMSVKLIDEYAGADLRHARSQVRRWMREVGSDANWLTVIGDKFSEDEEFVSRGLATLCRYYNRVGILLEKRVVMPDLVLGEMRADVMIFEKPLRGWLDFTVRRRRGDLQIAAASETLLAGYWRGVKMLLRRCRS